MFFDYQITGEITDDLLKINNTLPTLRRQYGFSNLLALTSSNNYKIINSVLSLDTEVNFDELIFKSVPDMSDLNTKILPLVKKYNSESKLSMKNPSIKRINTF